jgi:hypothetical protein
MIQIDSINFSDFKFKKKRYELHRVSGEYFCIWRKLFFRINHSDRFYINKNCLTLFNKIDEKYKDLGWAVISCRLVFNYDYFDEKNNIKSINFLLEEHLKNCFDFLETNKDYRTYPYMISKDFLYNELCNLQKHDPEKAKNLFLDFNEDPSNFFNSEKIGNMLINLLYENKTILFTSIKDFKMYLFDGVMHEWYPKLTQQTYYDI